MPTHTSPVKPQSRLPFGPLRDERRRNMQESASIVPTTSEVAKIIIMPIRARYQKWARWGFLRTPPNEDTNNEISVMDTWIVRMVVYVLLICFIFIFSDSWLNSTIPNSTDKPEQKRPGSLP